jgi:hypothetical protein
MFDKHTHAFTHPHSHTHAHTCTHTHAHTLGLRECLVVLAVNSANPLIDFYWQVTEWEHTHTHIVSNWQVMNSEKEAQLRGSMEQRHVQAQVV